jgi:hypothetical protein
MTRIQKTVAITALLAGPFIAASAYAALSPSNPTFTELATAAAAGYCISHHPYGTIETGSYTADGFEIVAPPGVVGAVRRNFVLNRTSDDDGASQTCDQACAQFAQGNAPYRGMALHQKVGAAARPTIQTSGIGDIGAMLYIDKQYRTQENVVAGMWSRGNTWHESDVAWADYCCCQEK